MNNDFSELIEPTNKRLYKWIYFIHFKKLCRGLLITEQKVLETELKKLSRYNPD